MVFVGAGQVTVNGCNSQSRQSLAFGYGKTDPIHSGIKHDIARSTVRDLLPNFDLFHRVQDRPRRRTAGSEHIVRPNSVKDDNRRFGKSFVDESGFDPARNEEFATTRLKQRIDNGMSAKPVAISFHRGARLDARS